MTPARAVLDLKSLSYLYSMMSFSILPSIFVSMSPSHSNGCVMVGLSKKNVICWL